MRKIELKLGTRSYPILIEETNLKRIPELLTPWNEDQKWIIISQKIIAQQFGDGLLNNLRKAGFRVEMITVPTGEKAKSLEQIKILAEKLLEKRCDRSTDDDRFHLQACLPANSRKGCRRDSLRPSRR